MGAGKARQLEPAKQSPHRQAPARTSHHEMATRPAPPAGYQPQRPASPARRPLASAAAAAAAAAAAVGDRGPGAGGGGRAGGSRGGLGVLLVSAQRGLGAGAGPARRGGDRGKGAPAAAAAGGTRQEGGGRGRGRGAGTARPGPTARCQLDPAHRVPCAHHRPTRGPCALSGEGAPSVGGKSWGLEEGLLAHRAPGHLGPPSLPVLRAAQGGQQVHLLHGTRCQQQRPHAARLPSLVPPTGDWPQPQKGGQPGAV